MNHVQISPGISRKKFITPGAREANFDKPSGQLGHVPVLMTHFHPGIVHVPRNLVHHRRHIAGMKHNVIMLGLK